jgi:hypothetical protein
MGSNEVVGEMVCECGEVFVLRDDDDAQEFGERLDAHVQDHHQALIAVQDFPHT